MNRQEIDWVLDEVRKANPNTALFIPDAVYQYCEPRPARGNAYIVAVRHDGNVLSVAKCGTHDDGSVFDQLSAAQVNCEWWRTRLDHGRTADVMRVVPL